MEVGEARRLLDVAEGASWDDIRHAYRRSIADAHPDRRGGDHALAIALNEAYAVLRLAHTSNRLDPAPPAPTRAPDPASGTQGPTARLPGPPEVLDGDTVRLLVPPDEAFARVLDACHHIGDVTYVDRSCSIMETLVRVEGEGVCSLLITLQGRADSTEAFCTLEAIEHVGTPPVRPVVEGLVEAIRRR
jgi:hypothetical protein